MLSTCSQWADCPSQCILPPHLVSGLLVCWAPAGPGGFLVMSSQLLEVLPPGFPSAAPTASFFCAGRSGGAEDLAQERVTSVGRAARLLPFSWHYHQTFLLPLKFGFLVGTLEAHSSCREKNQMPASPAVLTGFCKWKYLRILSKGTHAHLRAGMLDCGENVWCKHTLTFILNILVCRNTKLNILSTYTMRNPFIETKSNWRSKD